jgi:hypothetical protein
MPKITIPQKKKQWSVGYISDYLSDVIKSENVSFDNPFGAPSLSPALVPHTVTQDAPAIQVPTAFKRANIDGTDSFFAAAEQLYRVSTVNVFTNHFVPDPMPSAPTGLVDADVALFGKTVGLTPGQDIMVVSTTGNNLSIFNNDESFSTPAWRNDWWTGLSVGVTLVTVNTPQLVITATNHGFATGDMVILRSLPASPLVPLATAISSSTNTSPITINTTAAHGFQTGDTVTIANHAVNTAANGTFVITVTGANAFTLNGSTGNGAGINTGTATEVDPQLLNRVFVVTVLALNEFTIVDTSGNQLPHGAASGGTFFRIFNHTTQTESLGQPPLNAGVPHPMIVFGNAPELFILDGNALHSILGPLTPDPNFGTPNIGDFRDFNLVRQNRLVFRKGFVGVWMAATPYKIYIGLKNASDDAATSLVEEYDPFSEQVREFTVSEGLTVGWVQNDAMSLLDHKGAVKSFNGSGFDTYANFPPAFNANTITIHRNGIIPFGKYSLFLVQGLNNGFLTLGGTWLYSPDSKNLYHDAGPLLVNVTQKTFGSPNVATAGALGYFSGYPNYFAGLAANETQALASRGIFIVGVNVDGAGESRGFFITSKIASPDIDAVWRNFLLKYNMQVPNFGTQTGTLVLKYKTSDAPYRTGASGIMTATWNTATTFTVDPAPVLHAVVGDEIWVLDGNGAGASAHITNIAGLVVTIDEALLASPTGKFNFMPDNWRKLAPPITDTAKQSKLIDITTSLTEWVQFKVELRGSLAPIVEELQAGFEPSLLIEK